MQFYAENDAIIYSIQRTFLPVSANLLRSFRELAIWLEVSLQVKRGHLDNIGWMNGLWGDLWSGLLPPLWRGEGGSRFMEEYYTKITRKIFAYFSKINLAPVQWDRYARGFVVLSNFVKTYQSSKTPSSCLDIIRNTSIMKIWSVFWVRANARNVSFKALYGGQFTLSAQVDETKLPY